MNGLLSMTGSRIGAHSFRVRYSGAITTTGLAIAAMYFARDTSPTGYRRGELRPESGTLTVRMALYPMLELTSFYTCRVGLIYNRRSFPASIPLHAKSMERWWH